MTISPNASTVWRNYETDGVPSSGNHKVKKSATRTWGTAVETVLDAFTTNGGLIFATKTLMDAQAATYTEPRSAWVYADSTASNNGVYVLNPTTDTWTKVGRLPYDFVIGTDTGAGTANAIQITTDIPVSDGMIVAFALFEATTASPVTVSINGGAALTLKTNRGSNASGLSADMEIWGRVRSSDNTMRLLNDQDVSALVAQAEAARDAAVAAAAAIPSQVVDRTEMKALDTAIVKVAFLKESGREGWFKWKTGDYSAQIAADTAEGIYIKADSVAATSGAWVRQYDGSVDVRWFGATSDGTDNAAVFNALPAEAGIYIPAGEWTLKSTWNKASGVVRGEGYQSCLVFEDMAGANGIVFAPTDVQTTSGCIGLSIKCKTQNGGKAISTPQDATQYTLKRSSFVWEYLLIAGYTIQTPGLNNAFETIETWACCIEQGDAWNVGLHECDGYGNYRSDTDPATQDDSCFIRLKAASAMLTAHLKDFTCANVKRGVEIGDRCFFTIDGFDIAHSYNGIYQIAGTTFFGESRVTNGNINSQGDGIYFDGIATRVVSNVVIRRHKFGWTAAAYDWKGINLVSCNYVWLTNVMVFPDESTTAWAGTHYGIYLSACGGVFIEGYYVGPGVDRAVLANNCTMVIADNAFTFQNAAGDIVYRLIGNTRESHFGAVKKVSTFSGSLHSDDGTIVYTTVDVDELLGLDRVPVGTSLTLSANVAGAITVTGSFHNVDTNAAAASGELATITPSAWITTGTRLTLRSTSSVRDITLKDGTGNLQLAGDFVLSHVQDRIVLMWDAGQSVWNEVSRSDNTA